MDLTNFIPPLTSCFKILFVICWLFTSGISNPISKVREISFRGKVYKETDVSAIVSIPNQLIIGSDEGTAIQILDEIKFGQSYEVKRKKITLISGKKEIDIEGMALRDSILYVIGSHSLKRTKLNPSKSSSENRAKMAETIKEVSRNHLFRIPLSQLQDTLSPNFKSISLQQIIHSDKVLGRFAQIPSKENGIDIEGLAVSGNNTLYLGFRSPVLRGNYVPVMVLKYDSPQNYELRYINLKGQGIRSLLKVSDGFLLIAGPAGDSEGSFKLYYWDGKDGIPDKGINPSDLVLVNTIPCEKGSKPEGMTLLKEDANHYEVIIVFDGSKSGNPTVYRIYKPEN